MNVFRDPTGPIEEGFEGKVGNVPIGLIKTITKRKVEGFSVSAIRNDFIIGAGPNVSCDSYGDQERQNDQNRNYVSGASHSLTNPEYEGCELIRVGTYHRAPLELRTAGMVIMTIFTSPQNERLRAYSTSAATRCG
jgi:hypothetical protein